jgi:hypothetical protein
MDSLVLSEPVLRALINQAANRCGEGTFDDLAETISASTQSIYKWYAGTSMPDGAHLFKMLVLAGWVSDTVKDRFLH